MVIRSRVIRTHRAARWAAAVVAGATGLIGATPGLATAAPAAAAFVPIHEPWDGGRAARPRPAKAVCKAATTTVALVACADDRTENLDVTIDAVREKQWDAAGAKRRAAINADDAAWRAERGPVCEVSYPAAGGGTVGEIVVAQCQTGLSRARLAAVRGRPVPTAQLVATDDTDPHATQYAPTANGSLIGAIDTQGDQTGGVVIAWVVIGGYKGFTVRTGAFTYVDGSFTDKGIVAGHPGGHQVAAGQEYVFDIDYSRLAQDPHEADGTGRFEYRSGPNVVGAWK